MKLIFDVLKAPFFKVWNFFACQLTILFLYIIGYWLSNQTGASVVIWSVFCIYLVCVLIGMFPLKCRKFILPVINFYAAAVALLTFFGGVFVKTPDPLNTLALIMQTNGHETKEFFASYVSASVIITVMLTVLVVVFIYKVLTSVWVSSFVKKYSSFATLLSVLSFFPVFIEYTIAYASPYIISFSKPFDNFVIRDLNDYVVSPCLEETTDGHPTAVVVIIGESLTKSHCGLYSYNKNTNPKLKELEEKGNLFVFKNIYSSQTITSKAFKDILSTYDARKDEDWYKCQTIPTVVKAMGYNTLWCSNQQSTGLYDAIPNHYAELCDSTYFTPNGAQYDEMLIEPFNNYISKASGKSFVILHMMGSHEKFNKRYPEKFSVFDAKDYMDCPDSQRQTLAYYDNSVLYNDYVVSKLFSVLKDIDAIAFYFPDHGLDVYESNPNFAGHSEGTNASQIAGKKIPFMVYVSDLYKQKHKVQLDRIAKSIETNGNTQGFIYSLTDILGYRMCGSNVVEKHSVFYK